MREAVPIGMDNLSLPYFYTKERETGRMKIKMENYYLYGKEKGTGLPVPSEVTGSKPVLLLQPDVVAGKEHGVVFPFQPGGHLG